jgi:hypothetical protein
VFHQLGTIDVGDHNRSQEGLVDSFHDCQRPSATATDHNAVGLHQVSDSAASPRNSGLLTTSTSTLAWL